MDYPTMTNCSSTVAGEVGDIVTGSTWLPQPVPRLTNQQLACKIQSEISNPSQTSSMKTHNFFFFLFRLMASINGESTLK